MSRIIRPGGARSSEYNDLLYRINSLQGQLSNLGGGDPTAYQPRANIRFDMARYNSSVPEARGTQEAWIRAGGATAAEQSIAKVVFIDSSESPPIQLADLSVPQKLDVSATGNLGRLDTAFSATGRVDYLVYAFLDSWAGGTITTVGMIPRPLVSGVTMAAMKRSAATSTVITLGSGQGARFAVGAHVIIREGVAPGDLWNQGLITASTANTVSVLPNAPSGSWSEVRNANFAGGETVEILQVDRFEPRLRSSTTTYDGGRPYAYLGMVQANNTTIHNVRHCGDMYYPPDVGAIGSGSISANISLVCSFGRYAGLHIREVEMAVNANRTSGTGSFALSSRQSLYTSIYKGRMGPVGSSATHAATWWQGLDQSSIGAAWLQWTETGAAVMSYDVHLIGWRETAC